MTIRKMTIGTKFALTGSLLMILSGVLGGVALLGLGRVVSTVNHLADDSLPGLALCSRAEAALNEMRGDMLKHIGAPDQTNRQAAEANIRKLRQTVSEALQGYEKTIQEDQERLLYSKVGPAFERYYAVCDGVLAVSRTGNGAEAYKKYDDESIKTGVYKAARAAIQALTQYNRDNGARYSADAHRAASEARWLIWALWVTSVVCGCGLLVLLVRNVSRALRRMARQLSEGASQVAAAAAQVSSASQSLAQGSSQQAASLEETSASTQEISSMANRNTEHSGASAALMAQSQEKFRETNRQLQEMVAAMDGIDASSTQISRIIKVIDEIAFQTNILALNAAVEAARAGESGLGFAVVADEVRNLAQRSAQAAKDTAGLIAESIARSRGGKEKVHVVAEAIRAISEEAARIRRLVDEVSTGSREQSHGIEQIARAISQMEHVTQTSAANAEESAAAAEQLTAQSRTMEEMVAELHEMVSG